MDSPRSPLEKTRRSHYLAGMGAALVWLKARPKEARCACAPGVAVQGCCNFTVSEGHFVLRNQGHCTTTHFFSHLPLGPGPFGWDQRNFLFLAEVLHNGHFHFLAPLFPPLY